MKSPFSRFQRAKRRARRKGRSHGRQGHPNSAWKGGPVPYLESLHAQYSQEIRILDQRLHIVEGQSITSVEEDIADKTSEEYQIKQLEKERSSYEDRLSELLQEKVGVDSENPTGKAARHRHVPTWLYSLALLGLAIGEYFVTLPAVEVLLNDESWKAWIITGSFSALSIIAAHLIGITLKVEIDRDKPQPATQKIGALVIFLGLVIVILFLSALRSRSVRNVPVSFWMSDTVFGTVLFFFIQMTFISCAIALSYYNHSEVESDISRSKRRIKRLTKKIRGLTKARLIPSRGNLTPEKREVQVNAINAAKQVLEAEYQELCAIYRTSNLLAQKTSFDEPGPGLYNPPLNDK
jgi:hypothetical protein